MVVGGVTSDGTISDYDSYLMGFAIRAVRGSNHHLRRLDLRHSSVGNTISVSFHDNSAGDDEFTFGILYTIVRRANTSGIRADYYFTGPYAQSFEFTNTALINNNYPGFSVLSGFDFRFDDTDHHIRKIAIDPVSNEQYRVTFTDDEEDNPVSGRIEYVNVHE